MTKPYIAYITERGQGAIMTLSKKDTMTFAHSNVVKPSDSFWLIPTWEAFDAAS